MRPKLTIAAVTLIAVLVTVGCGSDDGPASPFPERRVVAGAVTVTITPARIDAAGATFSVVVDTHAVELSMDLTAAQLEVDGTLWTGARWEGSGPGGHHRSGELQFDAAGPARGTARLTLPGFPAPVEASWDLAG